MRQPPLKCSSGCRMISGVKLRPERIKAALCSASSASICYILHASGQSYNYNAMVPATRPLSFPYARTHTHTRAHTHTRGPPHARGPRYGQSGG